MCQMDLGNRHLTWRISYLDPLGPIWGKVSDILKLRSSPARPNLPAELWHDTAAHCGPGREGLHKGRDQVEEYVLHGLLRSLADISPLRWLIPEAPSEVLVPRRAWFRNQKPQVLAIRNR